MALALRMAMRLSHSILGNGSGPPAVTDGLALAGTTNMFLILSNSTDALLQAGA